MDIPLTHDILINNSGRRIAIESQSKFTSGCKFGQFPFEAWKKCLKGLILSLISQRL